jgi:hypothetical protein
MHGGQQTAVHHRDDPLTVFFWKNRNDNFDEPITA